MRDRWLAILLSALVVLCGVAGAVPTGAMAEQASDPSAPAAGQLDAGASFSCAIVAGGQVRCWGYGVDGELGYPGVTTVGASNTPAAVGPVDLGAGFTATAISSGDFHTCAIRNDGSVVCWGYGADGRLGYGNTSNVGDMQTPGSAGPVDLGGHTAKAISAGGAHTCAILDDGSVRCWGFGGKGQLGYGNIANAGDTPATTPGKMGPVDLGPGRTAIAISAGGRHTCAILKDRSVRCWGYGSYGQLGYGNTTDVAAPYGAGNLAGVACPSGSQCTAVDSYGRRVTFDPTAPGTPTPATIDGGHALRAVTCPSASQCTAIDYSGQQVTFDPSAPDYPTPTTIDSGTTTLLGVACSSVSQCTAVDSAGGQVTFNPSAAATPTPVTIDSGRVLGGVACPSGSQCTAVDYSGGMVTFDPNAASAPAPITIDSGNALSAVACPSATQCTAVDYYGLQVTFDPTKSTALAPITIDSGHPLYAVACPSVSQCTAVDDLERMVTFNPTGSGAPTPITIDSGSALSGVACASVSQCTAVDSAGGEVTFNPTAAATPTATTVDTFGPVDLGPGAKATAISAGANHTCVILQSGRVLCWGYGSDGELGDGNRSPIGDDETPGSVGPVDPGPGRTAVAISAGANHTCAVLDDGSVRCWGLGASGRLGYGNANNAGDTAATIPGKLGPVDLGAGRTAVAITAGGRHTCARLDDGHVRCWGYGGNGRLGYCNENSVGYMQTPGSAGPVNLVADDGGALCPTPAAVPLNVSPPSISGQAVTGQTLTEAHGTWSPSPTGYTYQWQRCDSAGANCGAITGATGQSYTPTAIDVGSTVRVLETASNAVGASAPAASTHTAIVTASALATVADSARARGWRDCLAAVSIRAKHARALTHRGSKRQRARARRRLARQLTSGRRHCLALYGRTPGHVTGLRAIAHGSTKIELDFSAPGTNGNNPPVVTTYLVKQSLRPIRDQRAFTRAQALCKGACRFTVTRLGTNVALMITALHPHTTYYYAVAALDNVTARPGPRTPTIEATTA